MNEEIIVSNTGLDKPVLSEELAKYKELAEVFIRSGFFNDIKSASQGIVKILAGKELGLSPIMAMQKIYLIPSRGGITLQVAGSEIASKIKQSRYDYKVLELTEMNCKLKFFEDGNELGEYEYKIEDAERAGLAKKDIWKMYPKAMLFNRAISAGYKIFTPDIFEIPVYTEGEILASEPNTEPKTNIDLVKDSILKSKIEPVQIPPQLPTNQFPETIDTNSQMVYKNLKGTDSEGNFGILAQPTQTDLPTPPPNETQIETKLKFPLTIDEGFKRLRPYKGIIAGLPNIPDALLEKFRKTLDDDGSGFTDEVINGMSRLFENKDNTVYFDLFCEKIYKKTYDDLTNAEGIILLFYFDYKKKGQITVPEFLKTILDREE